MLSNCCKIGFPAATGAGVLDVGAIEARKFAGNGTGDSFGGIWIGCSADPSFLSRIPGTYLVFLKNRPNLRFTALVTRLGSLWGLLLRLFFSLLRRLLRRPLLGLRGRLLRLRLWLHLWLHWCLYLCLCRCMRLHRHRGQILLFYRRPRKLAEAGGASSWRWRGHLLQVRLLADPKLAPRRRMVAMRRRMVV